MKQNKITKQKIEKYFKLTSRALKIACDSVVKGKRKQAEEIFIMVRCYLDDSVHFKEKGDFVNAYGALNYAHGWLDCGARLGILKVSDRELFTI